MRKHTHGSGNSTDSLLDIWTYIYENNENELCAKRNLKQKFGEKAYLDFERYALGGSEPYARAIPSSQISQLAGFSVSDSDRIVLEQRGIRALFDMRDSRNRDKIQENQLSANRILLSATLILAIAAAWPMVNGIISDALKPYLNFGVGIAIAVIFIYIFLQSRRP